MCVDDWEFIRNYEDTYKVSKTGLVKAIDRINYRGYHLKEHIMKYATDRNGYQRVYLTKYAKTKSKLVHVLVAETFIPDKSNFKSLPDEDRSKIDFNKLEVNHIDENKANNNVENLEWCTHKYNSSYGTRTSRIIPKTIEKTRTPVDQYDLDGNLIKEWYSMNEASRTLNLIQQNISKCCHGKRNTVGGFKWKFHVEKEGD